MYTVLVIGCYVFGLVIDRGFFFSVLHALFNGRLNYLSECECLYLGSGSYCGRGVVCSGSR